MHTFMRRQTKTNDKIQFQRKSNKFNFEMHLQNETTVTILIF